MKMSYGSSTWNEDSQFQDARRRSVFSWLCPYCGRDCESEREATTWGGNGWVEDRFVCCSRCGWWAYESDSEDIDGLSTYHSLAAVLKSFDSDSPDVPIEPLVSAINQHADLIGSIHPAKLEELIGAVYSEVLGYKVERCSYGRPDRGIDLVMMRKEDGHILAFQVKRYKRPIELGQIQQFFGAMVDDNRKEGVFVTSGRFRSGAVSTADALKRKTGIRIDLVDGKRLLEFIGIMNSARRTPKAIDFPFWESHPYYGEQ
jgi:hypothetical protein